MDIFKEKKKTSGRKKIEIKKLENDANKQVTFSKRRAGLFKKASELCILCNVKATIIVFSPANKLFCFGQPNTETIINNYVKGTTKFEPAESSIGNNSDICEEYNRQYEEAIKKLELEKKQLADVEIESSVKVSDKGYRWSNPTDEMSSEQLEEFMVSIYELRSNVAERADKLVMMLAGL